MDSLGATVAQPAECNSSAGQGALGDTRDTSRVSPPVHEESHEESGDQDEAVETLVAGRTRRLNAGNRMQRLLDQEIEHDELFAEEADDRDFESKDEEDVFDSDFDSTSSEEENQAHEELTEKDIERVAKQKKAAVKASKRAALFLPRKLRLALQAGGADTKTETTTIVAPSTQTFDVDASSPSKRRRLSRSLSPDLLPSRRTTSRATALNYIEKVDVRLAESMNHPAALRKGLPKATTRKLTQAELIAEALETEERNKESLRQFYSREEERKETERRLRRGRYVIEGPCLRWVSKRVDKRKSMVTEVVNNAEKQPTIQASIQIPSWKPPEHPLDTLMKQVPDTPLNQHFDPGLTLAPSLPLPTTTCMNIVDEISAIVDEAPDFEPQTFLSIENIPYPTRPQLYAAILGSHVDWSSQKPIAEKHRRITGRKIPMCVISQREAKYRDPETGLPFRNVQCRNSLRSVVDSDWQWNSTWQSFNGLQQQQQQHGCNDEGLFAKLLSRQAQENVKNQRSKVQLEDAERDDVSVLVPSAAKTGKSSMKSASKSRTKRTSTTVSAKQVTIEG